MFKKIVLGATTCAALSALPVDATAADPQVSIKTSMGEIVVELYPDKAPKTVENFLQYVREGFFGGTIFHRVIGTFMIQGGGYTKDFYAPGTKDYGEKPTRAPIALESNNGLKNDAGWVAMARLSKPDTADAQFFINTVDNPFLNYESRRKPGYAVFGKVVSGMDVVKAIAATPTRTLGDFENVPVSPVTIESASVLEGR